MSADPGVPLPEARLRETFERAGKDSSLGGSSTLETISDLSYACISGINKSKDAVAFALGAFLQIHAADKDERPVTSDEAYAFVAAVYDYMSQAVDFVEKGASNEEAIRIISALALASPDRLYRPKK